MNRRQVGLIPHFSLSEKGFKQSGCDSLQFPELGKLRFPQCPKREFLATVQNGGGGWGLSHGGRHSPAPFPDRGPPCRVVCCPLLPPAEPFRGIAWDWLIGWEWGCGAGTPHHHFLLWAVVSCRCLVTMGKIMAA